MSTFNQNSNFLGEIQAEKNLVLSSESGEIQLKNGEIALTPASKIEFRSNGVTTASVSIPEKNGTLTEFDDLTIVNLFKASTDANSKASATSLESATDIYVKGLDDSFKFELSDSTFGVMYPLGGTDGEDWRHSVELNDSAVSLYAYDGEESSKVGFKASSDGAVIFAGNANVVEVTSDAVSILKPISIADLTVGGNLSVSGTSTLTGAVTAKSTLAVTGATTLNSTLKVTGASTMAAVSATTLSASSTLTVSGATTLKSTLGVTGVSTLAAVSATNISASGTLSVSGASTLAGVSAGAVSASSLTSTGDLNVNGASLLFGNLTVTGNTDLGRISVNSSGGTIGISGVVSLDSGSKIVLSSVGNGSVGSESCYILFPSDNDITFVDTNGTTKLSTLLAASGSLPDGILTSANLHNGNVIEGDAVGGYVEYNVEMQLVACHADIMTQTCGTVYVSDTIDGITGLSNVTYVVPNCSAVSSAVSALDTRITALENSAGTSDYQGSKFVVANDSSASDADKYTITATWENYSSTYTWTIALAGTYLSDIDLDTAIVQVRDSSGNVVFPNILIETSTITITMLVESEPDVGSFKAIVIA